MSNAMKYITESLGSTGFAVLRGQIAYTQRPDLWAHGMDAASDFADKSLAGKLNTLAGCKHYLARFDGIEGATLIKVIARSRDQLETRIQWITGYRASLLIHESEMVGELDPADIPARNPSMQSGDLHAGVMTAEPGRKCHDCEWYSAGGTCSNAKESQILHPVPNVLRRCKGFRPPFANSDGRTAAQLWPELFKKTV